MTLDELKERIRQICAETSTEVWKVKVQGRDKLYALFQEYRDEVFKISKRQPEHWEVENALKGGSPDWHTYLRSEGLAFITCSCGSREDSCSEDGVGNFSTFVFMPDGEVFRQVEKKS